jgi:DNA ligase 1
MNTSEVFELVEKIGATASSLEKLELLKKGMSDRLFHAVMVHAYSPRITYGIRDDVPTGTSSGLVDFGDAAVWKLLDDLAGRALTGNAARAAIQNMMDSMTWPASSLLWRILRKDMRSGFTAQSLNKVAPGWLPAYPYQRCSLPAKSNMGTWNWAEGVISQIKADGAFANVDVSSDGEVSISTRQGSPLPVELLGALPGVIAQTLNRGTQSHGELLVVDVSGQILSRTDGNGILNSVLQGGQVPIGHSVEFHVWDQIPLSAVKAKGTHSVKYKERLKGLISQLAESSKSSPLKLIETRVVYSLAEAFDHYRQALARGLEGVVLKSMNALWKDGTSKDQVKLKLEVDVDLKVVAIVPGRSGTKNEGRAGSLRCESACGELVVDVAVKNEKMRAQVDSDPGAWINGIVAVRANDVQEPGKSSRAHSLFLPRLVEPAVRFDKTVADTLDQIKDQFAKAAA